ncbi:Dps family protein [Pseudarthrobacter sp. NCCP-2145]|uniref:Dps family protein n=1 Tax=Pseudarthrobacter sp. NCCP-2145 TaxID=2942290 RepID=UPI002041109E|nr:DNA starvation/stationary phase protection protein [Pseudarthrobacter sp. NCCP-2145]GKV73793.1 putative starvation-induced DNA protecting protein/ferritin and Dps [Pseudarthrobacter sp. NCCP-2145]
MKASPTLAGNLQTVLTDLIELHLQGKQAHWNLVGTNFRDLHLQLDEIIAAARLFADQAAERMRALHALPDGRSGTVAAGTRLDGFPEGLTSTKQTVKLITARLERTVQTMRDVHDEVDEEDPTSADLLHAAIERLEQLAWMVNAETMAPTASVTEPVGT